MKDLSNQQFDELTAISPTTQRKHGCVVWKCKCSCGNICYVRSTRLTSKNTKSCGHLKSKYRNTRRDNLKGKIFGDFIVDYYDFSDPKTHYCVWKCNCITCGEVRYLTSHQLKLGWKLKCNHKE